MSANKENIGTSEAGWDARHEFVRELVYRAHLYLNSSPQNPYDWFENLRDFYSIACPFIQERENIKKRINDVKDLIYGTRDKTGRHLTQREQQANMNKAYEEIRDLFEIIHISVYRSGIYLPVYKKKDPGKAIMDVGL